jgi:hypothetical protein
VKPLYLLDPGWIVRHLRGVQAYTETLLKIGAPQLALSILSLAELYEGVYRARDPAAAERAVVTFASDKTNCAAKVRECTGLESSLTPTLSSLDTGGEGREWGDSARAGICELWLGAWCKRASRGSSRESGGT